MQKEVIYQNGAPILVSVIHDDEFYQARVDNPNFVTILARLATDDTDVTIVDLFDVSQAVSDRLNRLSDRVTCVNGEVQFDGDGVHNALTDQVLRFLDEGVEDWKPLVAFMENVMQNPSEGSRNELFEWVQAAALTITDEGLIVGYKGCRPNEQDGIVYSTYAAPESDQVRVDDVLVTGYVPNVDGTVITMPRGVVDPDLTRTCSKGLHIGTYDYASGYAPVVKQVHVHPRDVVSVTSDSGRQKIRACRYEVVKTVSQKVDAPVYQAPKVAETNVNQAGFVIGSKVKTNTRLYSGHDVIEAGTVGKVVADDDIWASSTAMTVEFPNVKANTWSVRYFDKVEDVVDVTKAQPWDTRNNHTIQKRYPKGHPKAGQFVPKV